MNSRVAIQSLTLAKREGDKQRVRTCPAEEHERDHDHLANPVQLRRDPSREPHGAEGRERLEERLLQREAGARHERERRQYHGVQRDDGDRERLTLRERRHPAAERVHVRVAADLGPHHEEEEGEGRHLDAAACRGAPGTHEHQHVGDKERLRLSLAVVDRIEARRARRDPLEERGEELVAGSQRPHRPCVFPLEERHSDGPEAEEEAHRSERQFRVQGPAPRIMDATAELEPNREPEAPGDDRERDREDDPPIPDEADEAVAPKRESGVVEGRDRSENAAPDRRSEAEVICEPQAQREHCGRERLEKDREQDDPDDDAPHVGEAGDAAFGLRDQTAPKPEPTREKEREERGERHDAEPACLHEREDDDVTAGRPVSRRVDHN
jgi:hypothetical protein